METKTLTRADIADALYNKLGFSHTDSFKLIDSVLNTMIDAFGRGEEVKLARFASFIPHKKNERIGRNPKTGTQHVISERTVLSFKASNSLKSVLKNG